MINCDKCRKDIEDFTLCVHLKIGKMGRMAPHYLDVERWYHFECYDDIRRYKK